ncbi:MAG: hypothetical protein JSU05_15300 [Bacteroidetes bacterium]|nr:hypothetical protein [Bacteroidota bacterium]
MSSKKEQARRDIIWVFTIVLGILLGFFIKKVSLGLLLGLVLGLVAVGFGRKN